MVIFIFWSIIFMYYNFTYFVILYSEREVDGQICIAQYNIEMVAASLKESEI